MKKLVNTLSLSHEEWLEWRRKGIGGSDAAAICGLNPWCSAVRVYLDKVEPLDEPDQDNERMRIGRDLENYVAKRFEEATGKKVRRNNFMMAHDNHDFMIANVDREVVGENAILECKTTNSYAVKDWKDGKTPVHYEIQCHHYMAVTGADRVYIACLLGNEAFVWHVIERDEEVVDYLIQLEKSFWENNVLAKEPPAPDGSDDYDNILAYKYADTNEGEITFVDIDAEKNIKRIIELKALQDEIKREQKLLEQKLKKELGEHEIGITADHRVTWKKQNRSSVDTRRLKEEEPEIFEKYQKTSEFRVLRIN